jgi:iron complex outermembrane receptor protein
MSLTAKNLLRAGAGISALAFLSVSTAALAQETPPAEAATDTAAPAPAAEEGAIVVTGSRIKTVTPFNSPDPITVVDPGQVKKEGKFELAEALQSSPIANGSTQITSALSSNFVTNGGPGSQTIDLRGLGANRTLVLLNGRRAGPAGTRGGVSSFDLNVLPLSVVSDISILKTGASSIYGSDAVAGVVNIVTNKRANGVTLNLNSSIPTDSGGEQYRISGTRGKSCDRGHFLVAGEYSHTNELRRGDRDYLACPTANIFDSAGNPKDLIDPRTGQSHCEDLRWGHVWTYDLIGNLRLDGPAGRNTGINTSVGGRAVLMQYQYPTGPGSGNLGIPAFGPPAYGGDFVAPAGFYPTGYDATSMAVQNAYHPFVEEQTIIPKTDLYTVFADASYELSDAVEVFGEFLFNRRETYQNGWRQFWNFGYTGDLYGTGGPNSRADNYWAPGWKGVNYLSPTAITNHADSSQRVDYYRGVGGLRGGLGGDWRYEVYGQYSKSIGRYRTEQILQDAYDSGYFQTQSCVGTKLPKSGKNCIDIPWTDPYFLRGELTPQQVGFLFDWEEGKTVYEQLTGEATVTGTPFNLPAGPLGVAMGVSVRQDKIVDTPGAITLAANAWGNTASGITAGKTLTSEAFAELSIPLLRDKSFFEDVTLSAAGRVTNVKATRKSDGFTAEDNGNFTYKLGLNWTVTDWLRFRGSYGTSYRAPALFEQFLADETSFLSGIGRIDPCVNYTAGLAAGTTSQIVATNCAAAGIPGNLPSYSITPTVFTSGGVGVLKAETSKAMVIGAVLTPKFSFLGDTRLSLSVDYFEIKVNGEISQLGASNILAGCYRSTQFASEPLCQLFTRGTSGATQFQVQKVFDKYINVASQRNTGLDVAMNLTQDLGKLGSFSLRGDMTWQFKKEGRLLPTSPLRSTVGYIGDPKWVGDFRASWELPSKTTLFYSLNVIGGASSRPLLIEAFPTGCITSQNTSTTPPTPIYGTYCPNVDVPAVFYHNISVTQDIADGKFSITAGVSNLFDKHPPMISTLNGGTVGLLGPVVATSQYPFVGRKVFVNATAKY